MGQRTPCPVDDCGRPSTARGLCSKHYSYWYRETHGRKRHVYTVTCEECGQTTKVTGPHVRYCSLTCVAQVASRKARERRLPVLHPNPDPVTHLPSKHPVRRPPVPRPEWWKLLVYGPCARCGESFMAVAASYDTRPRYCSRRCARGRNKERRRAMKRDAYVADVNRRAIFERDGWRCQLCRKRVDAKQTAPHPRAPTIDHIIPLACGGTHEPANCQTACFACNCIKSHTGTGDQLRLIG